MTATLPAGDLPIGPAWRIRPAHGGSGNIIACGRCDEVVAAPTDPEFTLARRKRRHVCRDQQPPPRKALHPRTPTPPGVWPRCEVHPAEPLDYAAHAAPLSSASWWQCPECAAAGEPTWQPWTLVGAGQKAHAEQPITPKGHTRRPPHEETR